MDNQSSSLQAFEHFDFRELPIGVYMTSFDGQFQVCNKAMRRILNLPLEGPINANIKQFYVNPKERDDAIEKILKSENEGSNSGKSLLQFRVNGREIFVEDFCKPIRDTEDGAIVRFVGCLVDITSDFVSRQSERKSQETAAEITFDIGKTLHTSNTTLLMADQTLMSIISALEPNPFKQMSVPQSDELRDILSAGAKTLSRTIERFLSLADSERRSKALPKSKWEKLQHNLKLLSNFETDIPEIEFRPSALYNIARNVSDICKEVVPGNLSKETIRELNRDAWNLLRITIIYDALKTRDAILQMEFALRTLQEYVTFDARETLKKENLVVNYLVDQAIAKMSNYAQNSHVKIEIREKCDEIIYVNERDFIRSLTNLLHNAIKYSWHREYPKPAWVSINSTEKDGKVYIEFENWGVPISKDEIEEGSVFKFGYRGLWSRDRGRLGTGIGLTDVKRVAQSEGGEVLIESRPARASNIDSSDYYDQPFITKVTLVFPISQYQS